MSATPGITFDPSVIIGANAGIADSSSSIYQSVNNASFIEAYTMMIGFFIVVFLVTRLIKWRKRSSANGFYRNGKLDLNLLQDDTERRVAKANRH